MCSVSPYHITLSNVLHVLSGFGRLIFDHGMSLEGHRCRLLEFAPMCGSEMVKHFCATPIRSDILTSCYQPTREGQMAEHI